MLLDLTTTSIGGFYPKEKHQFERPMNFGKWSRFAPYKVRRPFSNVASTIRNPDIEDFQPYSDSFAEAMKPLYDEYSDDLDILFMTLMNRTPWRLWNFWKGIPNPKGSAVEAMAVLEGTLRNFLPHGNMPGFSCTFI